MGLRNLAIQEPITSISIILFSKTVPGDWHLQNGNKPSGTINADPQFVNYTGDSKGDYHLRSTSPALKKGATRGVRSSGRKARVESSKTNLGAYSIGTLRSE